MRPVPPVLVAPLPAPVDPDPLLEVPAIPVAPDDAPVVPPVAPPLVPPPEVPLPVVPEEVGPVKPVPPLVPRPVELLLTVVAPPELPELAPEPVFVPATNGTPWALQ